MSIDYNELRDMVRIFDNPAAHTSIEVYDAADDLKTLAPDMARELLRRRDEPTTSKDVQLPSPVRMPGDETTWTEWDAADDWFTVAVTDHDNVALIDNCDLDAAMFLAPEQAEGLAHALLAAAAEANERIEHGSKADV